MPKRYPGIHLRPDGRYEGKYRDRDGQRRSVYGATAEEAQRRRQKAIADAAAGKVSRTERRSLGSWLDEWLEEIAKPRLRPRTYDSYRQMLTLHLLPELGTKPLGKLATSDVRRLLKAKLDAGLSRRTVVYLRAILRSALNAALDELIPRNVAAGDVLPWRQDDEDGERANPLSLTEARQFVAVARHDRHAALYAVALLGLRKGEVLGLRWEDVDLDGAVLVVRQTLQRVWRYDGDRISGALEYGRPKTKKSSRTIALPAAVVQLLREQEWRQRQDRRRAKARYQESGLVFTTAWGTPLEPRNVSRSFHALLARAGIARRRFHDLRHGTGSYLQALGYGAKERMEQLGHSRPEMAALYAHELPEVQRLLADRLGALLFENPSDNLSDDTFDDRGVRKPGDDED